VCTHSPRQATICRSQRRYVLNHTTAPQSIQAISSSASFLVVLFFRPATVTAALLDRSLVLLTLHYTNTLSQNDGKKRRRIGSPPQRNMRQRTKRQISTSVDVRTLTAVQIETLEEAASILQLPTSALLDLVPNPHRRSNGRDKRPGRLCPEMAGTNNHGGNSPRTRRAWSRPVHQDNTASWGPTPMSDMCNMPALAFGLMPKQIADCLESFSPSVHEVQAGAQYDGMISCIVSKYFKTDAMKMKEVSEVLPNLLISLAWKCRELNQPPVSRPRSTYSRTTLRIFRISMTLPWYTFPLYFMIWTTDTASAQAPGGFACNEFVLPIEDRQSLIATQPLVAPASMNYLSGSAMGEYQYSSTYKDVGFKDFGDYPSTYGTDESSDLIDLSTETTLGSLESGSSDESCEKSGPTPRRPFQSPYDRQQTAQTRKNTACLRCRMQRIRVGSLLRCLSFY
jgi:hypothetical protein